jgi:DNA topoisomerase-2
MHLVCFCDSGLRGKADNGEQKTKPKAPPKKPAAAKAATKPAAKAATKKSTQTTLKPKASKKRPKDESDDEGSILSNVLVQDDSILSNTPPSAKKQKKAPAPKKKPGHPLEEVENESMNLDGPSESKPGKAGNATDRYQKITQLEHIIKRPDTYIGSVERTEQQMWVFNSQTEQMEIRKVGFVPGLYKIFDEILASNSNY